MAKTNRVEIEAARKAVADLMVYFDNVQVFGNRYDPTDENTIAVSIGDGNKFAIIGHVDSWRKDVANEGGECGPGCNCGAGVEDDDEDEDGDEEDGDSRGNRM